MRRLSLGAFAILLASGCVSESKYEDSKARERDLAWRLEAAEKSSKTEDSEKRTLLKKIEVLEEDNKVAREKLALANDALKDAKTTVDEELKARLAELQ